MLIEIREPTGMVSRLVCDPAESFWAVVARLQVQFPTATVSLRVSR